MKDGFIKVAAITPKIKVADVEYNESQILKACRESVQGGARLIVTPELCLTGATAGDLFYSDALITAALTSALRIAEQLKNENALFLIGMPVRAYGKLYSCAAAINNGKIIAFIPSKTLTKSQKRWFSVPNNDNIVFNGSAPITSALLACNEKSSFTVEVVFGNNAPVMGGAIVANMVAEPKIVDSSTDTLLRGISILYTCAVVRAEAGDGESVTNGAFISDNRIFENGEWISSGEGSNVCSEVDVDYIAYARRNGDREYDSFENAIEFSILEENTKLTRIIDEQPFCSMDALNAIEIQAAALATRLSYCKAKTAVIGLSGGLDSTLALLVTVKAFEHLGKDKKEIIAVTMPCFGTTQRTKSNAQKLAEALDVTFKTIDVTQSVKKHLKDIGHDGNTTDVTYENAQARERTQVLMDVANMSGGMVIGTGDMSELALGWATYNGDHMSMYSVNAGVTKTLVRSLVAKAMRDALIGKQEKLSKVLDGILKTPVSPELLPCKNGEISQITEDLVGPYELHDFFLYGLLARGDGAGKLYRTAVYAFADKYDEKTIEKWLRVFIRRFFAQQFKRSCSPDGPKVTCVSLSPKDGFVFPTDNSAATFLTELDERVKER